MLLLAGCIWVRLAKRVLLNLRMEPPTAPAGIRSPAVCRCGTIAHASFANIENISRIFLKQLINHCVGLQLHLARVYGSNAGTLLLQISTSFRTSGSRQKDKYNKNSCTINFLLDPFRVTGRITENHFYVSSARRTGTISLKYRLCSIHKKSLNAAGA
jgi:hypothetical protein